MDNMMLAKNDRSVDDPPITVVIFGPSGSGKSTYAEALCNVGFRRIEQLTTREPIVYIDSEGKAVNERESLANEYDFVTEAVFNKLMDGGKFAEYASFEKREGGNTRFVWYGSYLWKYLQPGFHVVTTNLDGARMLSNDERLKGKLVFVCLEADIALRLAHVAKRGRDSLSEIIRRAEDEYRQYDDLPSREKYEGFSSSFNFQEGLFFEPDVKIKTFGFNEVDSESLKFESITEDYFVGCVLEAVRRRLYGFYERYADELVDRDGNYVKKEGENGNDQLC